MALTVIDSTPALAVIDLQRAVLAVPTVHPMQDIVARSAALAAAFRRYELPVVLVSATGRAPGRTDAASGAFALDDDALTLAPELDPQPSDYRVTKQTWGAFHGTSLHAHLTGLGVTQIVLTGVATSAGVESTARAAHEHGYNVVLVTDAMTDRTERAHDSSVELVFPRIGETTTTAEFLSALDRAKG